MSLKRWCEIATPQKDVLQGTFKQSEFAEDITQVVGGTAPAEYQDAEQFFARTYITEGMRLLLISVAQRLAGQGGAGHPITDRVRRWQDPHAVGRLSPGFSLGTHLPSHRDSAGARQSRYHGSARGPGGGDRRHQALPQSAQNTGQTHHQHPVGRAGLAVSGRGRAHTSGRQRSVRHLARQGDPDGPDSSGRALCHLDGRAGGLHPSARDRQAVQGGRLRQQ